MQDGAPPHITRCDKDVLKHHFTEERVISRQFLHLRPPRSPDPNPWDFWLWGHLRQLVSVINQELYLISKTVFHDMFLTCPRIHCVHTAILRFQIVAENDGHHVETLL
ncbi:uncharacterized protein TNCV_413741 [Trichonephila clavipes]|nr:uncharacterized protein TNCV_413741 [Trichonephila clavipes]